MKLFTLSIDFSLAFIRGPLYSATREGGLIRTGASLNALEYNPSCQDRYAGLFFLGSLNEGNFPPVLNSRPGTILADVQEEFRTEGFCLITPERRREISRNWAARARLDPERRERMKESARRSKERYRDDPEHQAKRRTWAARAAAKRTPEQKARDARNGLESQRRRRASLTASERAIRNEKKRLWMREERAKRPEKVRAREKRLRDTSPSTKLARNMRARLWQAVRGRAKKVTSTLQLVGCTPEALRLHLESLFLPGMSWANYNHRGWHVDHVKACTQFDLTDPAQQRECFHYSNLQPLWAADNQRKYNK